MNASAELEIALTELLNQFEPDVAPATPIAAVDFFEDAHGLFVSAELIDGSSVYITLSLEEPISVFHTTAPKPAPPVRHLFCVRADS